MQLGTGNEKVDKFTGVYTPLQGDAAALAQYAANYMMKDPFPIGPENTAIAIFMQCVVHRK